MRKSVLIGILLLAFVLECRFSMPVAGFFAERCDPVISAGFHLTALLNGLDRRKEISRSLFSFCRDR